ncbi:hypothetical protein GUITHDRAFT_137871 [Guillardia theta CCMP2712]|uniref:MIR domain-containing protein n=1 Tax=Guillardia theta (strain CCMP2712) TaxID=905079 RepID=L1JEG8_GUITC|nr:hypothetical protein GUITHDRAFT_137871 [Guillardia theta CCMP2712]EKX46876.1 hypothetical protein GUITHDRAFT_137871 [Guillardia theta CCMP2712]|eukprot:XP_005833856.1 hypothetical protein GUITHDRAFT_137871 [Guillardia theta CCMP2712]
MDAMLEGGCVRRAADKTGQEMRSFVLAACILLALKSVAANDDEGQEFEVVTCGSAINLVHVQSRYRLHSHEVAYGSGSRQQSVTAVSFLADPNSLWVVRGEHGKQCPQGTQIKNGDTIRLTHLNTKRNLHSHFFESPLSKQQEVSGFGDKSSGDSGDEWVVEMKDEDYWKRGKRFRLKHKATGAYLHSHSNVG